MLTKYPNVLVDSGIKTRWLRQRNAERQGSALGDFKLVHHPKSTKSGCGGGFKASRLASSAFNLEDVLMTSTI
jgi:hypothetical protein